MADDQGRSSVCVWQRGGQEECVCVCVWAATISGNNGVQQFSAFQAEQLS